MNKFAVAMLSIASSAIAIKLDESRLTNIMAQIYDDEDSADNEVENLASDTEDQLIDEVSDDENEETNTPDDQGAPDCTYSNGNVCVTFEDFTEMYGD